MGVKYGSDRSSRSGSPESLSCKLVALWIALVGHCAAAGALRQAPGSATTDAKSAALRNYGSLPSSSEGNQGQVDPHRRFLSPDSSILRDTKLVFIRGAPAEKDIRLGLASSDRQSRWSPKWPLLRLLGATFVLAASCALAAPSFAQSPVIATITCTPHSGAALKSVVYFASVSSPGIAAVALDLAHFGDLASTVVSQTIPTFDTCILESGSASITLGCVVLGGVTAVAQSAGLPSNPLTDLPVVNGVFFTPGSEAAYDNFAPQGYALADFLYAQLSVSGLSSVAPGGKPNTLQDALVALRSQIRSDYTSGAKTGGAQ